MIKKYNIAFTPIFQSSQIINLAKSLSHIADKYLLGDYSLPHVTLYQFRREECEINTIWENITYKVSEKNIKLIFNEFSCVTFDNDTYWPSLMPNKRDLLDKIQCIIANIINMPVKTTYDPHMTLLNTKNKNYKQVVKKIMDQYITITDTFTLSLGECDDSGQFTNMLYSYKLTDKNKKIK